MRRKFLKYIIAVLLLFPITCYAQETINYNDAKIKFNIDETKWKEESLSKERTYIDKKWTNECGTIMTGSFDIYNELSDEELEGVSREYFNYENLLKNDNDATSLLEGFKNTYSVNNWSYKNYKMKFIEFSGTTQQSGIDIDYDIYITINNGYGFMIQYMRTDAVNKGTCENPISEIVASADSTISVKKMEEENMDDSSLIISLIIGLVLTFICYEAYPFIRVVLMKKEYNEQEAKKMALWNSIIVGFIFLVLTVSTNENATWSAGPAFLYYWINKSLWIKKKPKNNSSRKKEEQKQEEIQEEPVNDSGDEEGYTCDNCGADVKESDTVCPKCGASFVDEDVEDEEEDKVDTKEDDNYTSVCSNCGAKVKDSDKKCPKCGEKFEDEEEPPKKEKSNMDQKFY